MLLYFLRHGDPIYHPDCLTDKGKEQAESLSRRLLGSGIDEIYASSSVRAQQTARPLADKLGKPIHTMHWCHEDLAYRDFTIEEDGKRVWFFESEKFLSRMGRPDVAALGYDWERHPLFAATRCGEGFRRIAGHTDSFMATLGFRHDTENHCFVAEPPTGGEEKRIALFAHGGFGRAFLAHLLDIPFPFATRMMHNHSGMTVLWFRPYPDGLTFPRLIMFSGDGHLYKDVPSTVFNNDFAL